MENQENKKKRNKPLIFALIGGGVLLASIGGVFAANSITINGGGTVEFGQGLTSTSSCTSSLNATVNQTYNAGTGQFDASTISISNIDDQACNGKTIHVSLVGTASVICSVNGTHTTGANKDAFAITDDNDNATNQSITVTIPAGCDATTVRKVAITTS